MKISWLPTPFFCLALAASAACSGANPGFCETSADCGESEVCSASTQACEPSIVADADLAPPESDAATTCAQQCIPSAPLGWTGPMARAEARGETPAACAESFPTEHALLSSDITVSSDCECSCGTATGLACSSATVREWTSDEPSCELNSCGIINGTCLENSMSVGSGCAEVPSFMKDEGVLKATLGQLSGGSCSAPGASGTVSSQFESQTRLCQASLSADGCGPEEVCAPPSPNDFAEGLCIVQEGDLACPADSIYSERFVLYSGIDDTQSCDASSCSCSAPSGSCGGQVELRGGDEFTCGSVLATLKAASTPFGSSDLCAARPAGFARIAYAVNLNNRTCTRGGQATVQGQANGTGATTVCCSL